MTEWLKPVDLPVSSGYGPRGNPPEFHYGIDFSDGIAGHPIHAIADGTVTYAAWEPDGFGNTVTLTHPSGVKSGYGHMAAPTSLHVGDDVRQGDVLGYVGTTGASTGPHLHLWMGSSPNPPGVIDPSPYVLGAPTSGDDDVTQEQMDTLGQWLKDTEKRIEEKVLGDVGQWLKDVEGRVNAHTDAKVAQIAAGNVDLDKLADVVADKIAARLKD